MFRWFGGAGAKPTATAEKEERKEGQQQGDEHTAEDGNGGSDGNSRDATTSATASSSSSSGNISPIARPTPVASRPASVSVSSDGRVESPANATKRLPTAIAAPLRKASPTAAYAKIPRPLTPTTAAAAAAAASSGNSHAFAHAPHPVVVNAAAASTSSPALIRFDLNDERWWRDALPLMQLDAASFLQPLLFGSGPDVAGALSAPFSASPSSSAALPFHLSEETYTHLAPRVLDAFPALALLRFKLVPARINEERFWRTLFLLIAQWNSANAGGTGAAAASPHAPIAVATAAASASPAASARPLSSTMPKASRNGSISPGSGRSTPLASARASPNGSPRNITDFPALPPLPLLHHPPPLQQPHNQQQHPMSNSTPHPAQAAQLASMNAQLSAAHAQLASRDGQIRELQAALASKENVLASKDAALASTDATLQSNRAALSSQAAQIDMLSQKLHGVTMQLQVIQSALQHSLQIVACPNVEGVIAAHAAATSEAPQHVAATHAAPPSTSTAAAACAPAALPPAPASDGRLSTAPSAVVASDAPPAAPAAALQPHSHGSPSASARRFFECGRCHQSVPADAPAASPCVSHSGGSWTLTKDSVEFFELPPELRLNLRTEKARRLAAVQKEMRFIIDSDDPTTAPGSWSCCDAAEYTAEGCKRTNKHTLQPSK